IGSAIAQTLGGCGATVVGTATTGAGAQKIEQMFREHDIRGRAGVLDVTSPQSVEALFEELAADGLVPLILVNNAGITRDNLILRMKDEEWLDVIETNLNSV